MTEKHYEDIIGAGAIGLERGVAFKEFGIDYIQLEAGQIGSTIAWYPVQMLFHSSSDRLGLAGVPIQTSTQQKITREEYLAYLRALVMQFGLQVRSYERVTRATRLPGGDFELVTHAVDGEHRYQVDHVVLAIGAFHAPRMLDIPGEEMAHVSHYFHDPHTYFGKKLLIVGGRNSSVEAAVRCQRAGADVTLSYRRDDFDPKVVKFWLLPEVRAQIRDGLIRYLPRTTPIEIGKGTALLAPTDDYGAVIPDAVPIEIDADFVLLLTGYRQHATLFDQLCVKLPGDNRQPVHDPETMETNVPGVFVAGTAVAGTPPRKVTVIVETCHVHVPRILAAIQGKRVALPDGPVDD